MARHTFRDWMRLEQGGKLVRPHQPCVYFIGGTRGAIKIGHTTDIYTRLSRLQTGSQVPLHVHAVTPGGESVEAAYHRRFAEHRLRGEWFARCPEIVAEMKLLNAPPHPNEATHDR